MSKGAREPLDVGPPAESAPVIRDASVHDAGVLAALAGELGYPATAAQMAARLERLASSDRARVLVATDGVDGAVLGFCTVHLLATIHGDANVAQLTALVVSEQARGKGVGRTLVSEAEEWARRSEAGRIVVTTALHRAGAHAFYERLGYTHTGRRYARLLA